MILNIKNVNDVKEKIEKYFEVMRWMPDIERPRCKTTDFYRVVPPPVNENDAIPLRPDITSRDISEAWFIDEKWMTPPLIYPNEYAFLRDFFSGQPKKVLAYRYSPDKYDRKYVYRWAERLFKRIFDNVKA